MQIVTQYLIGCVLDKDSNMSKRRTLLTYIPCLKYRWVQKSGPIPIKMKYFDKYFGGPNGKRIERAFDVAKRSKKD